jgi:outer membrane receptor protein involved in Fe transport
MTRKQAKALRRTKAIKRQNNIHRIKNRAKTAATMAVAGAVLATPNIEISAQGAIEEIVVTSRKKEETLQDVPLQVSTLTEESLEQSGINTFEDYLLELPGVTAGGSGPGQNTIYIRGLASTTPNLTTAGVAGLAPNVSFYLDEQPLAQPGRNLDVYAADIARIEVLSTTRNTFRSQFTSRCCQNDHQQTKNGS